MKGPKDKELLQTLQGFYGPLGQSQSQARRVGWESDAAHLIRLRAIVEALAPLAELRDVLDIGCGEGRLLSVLNAYGYHGHYRGEDLMPDMLIRARRAHPEADFVCANLLHGGPEGDAIVCSGTLNTPLGPAHQEAAENALKSMWERTRKLLVLDFSASDGRRKGARLSSLDLEAMWRLAKTLTPLVTIREDLIAGEALMILRRSRRPTLESLLPEEHFAIDRARILLTAREPSSVRATLECTRDEEAELWRALADLLQGRTRNAESALRALLRHPLHKSRAQLHLALVLLATRRVEEAEALLHQACESSDSAADEARVVLAERALSAGRVAVADALIQGIKDPWMKREMSAD